ncbi:MAG: cation:proton antiporter [Rickettsiaceae bacterium]|nr:cation:proton antiporter [Rickettsiaceae bacterium]
MIMLVLFIKDVFTKILLLGTSTNIIALFFCFLAAYKVNSSYIDIAIIYFLLSSVSSCAYMRYFMQKESLK